VVLYGCEIWTLTLREEHRLRAFEDKVLRRIFGPKRDEVWEDGENCIFRELYSSPTIIRMIKSKGMRWVWFVIHMMKRVMHIGYRWERQKERDHS
jgi:hypothetical protein